MTYAKMDGMARCEACVDGKCGRGEEGRDSCSGPVLIRETLTI